LEGKLCPGALKLPGAFKSREIPSPAKGGVRYRAAKVHRQVRGAEMHITGTFVSILHSHHTPPSTYKYRRQIPRATSKKRLAKYARYGTDSPPLAHNGQVTKHELRKDSPTSGELIVVISHTEEREYSHLYRLRKLIT